MSDTAYIITQLTYIPVNNSDTTNTAESFGYSRHILFINNQ